MFKVLGNSRCLSNFCENKLHFNYMRFIKLLNLEKKQNELLFKVKTGLIYNSIYPLLTLKKRRIRKIQMLKYTLGIYSFFILSLLSPDSSSACLSTFIPFYCCQHLLSSLFLGEAGPFRADSRLVLCCGMHLFLPVACLPTQLNLMPCYLPLPLLVMSHSDPLRWIYPHLDLTLTVTPSLLHLFSCTPSPLACHMPTWA